MPTSTISFTGLTNEEVISSREKFGSNAITSAKEHTILHDILGILKEPMILLLLLASTIYFISSKYGDGIFMLVAIVLIAAISLYQDNKSRNALAALKTLTEPECKVIRNSEVISIKTEELVPGDLMMIEEGSPVPADGIIKQANDFSVNESILTGESMAVSKSENSEEKAVFQATTVVSGLAICEVTATGNNTRLAAIGKSIEAIKEEDTPLQKQIENFVKKMVVIGVVVFLIVWAINYFNSGSMLDSLLKALTLAMSIIPEEIPVTFTTFMALGAWRLMKMGIIVKQTKTVEALGSATVICTDKTGTITENRMELARFYSLPDNTISKYSDSLNDMEKELIRFAMWSSEPIPFDPMELAIHEAYKQTAPKDERPLYKMVHEYPLSGKPPMMTHVFENASGNRIMAAKGAPEAIIAVSTLDDTQKKNILLAVQTMAAEGFRVLGVGTTEMLGDAYPATQQELIFNFKGLVAFYDPPKKNIAAVFQSFYKAGIKVKIITGDNAATTTTIAKQVGFEGADNHCDGETIMQLEGEAPNKKVAATNIFTRMFPEAKLKVINALKDSKEIVAMTGDGVNDGPALKAAHIGIAMGKKGSDLAKRASSLILMNDDLSSMVDAVAMGRKIYTNIKKAIQYVISIHIPIVLTVFLPLALGWVYPNIFTPVHVIFMEMIMGPTCSIIYENEPMESNTMLEAPRPFTTTFFKLKELLTSIIQGLGITLGTLGIYQLSVYLQYDENTTRTMVFVTLITANIFLTLVNRSFYYSMVTTARYKNNLIPVIIVATILLSAVLLFIPVCSRFFQFEPLQLNQFVICIATGFVSVTWYEIVKWIKRNKKA